MSSFFYKKMGSKLLCENKLKQITNQMLSSGCSFRLEDWMSECLIDKLFFIRKFKIIDPPVISEFWTQSTVFKKETIIIFLEYLFIF